MHGIMKRFGLGAALYLAFMSNAYAYLDPGTGSMLLQGLIGAAVGGWVATRLYWHKLKSFFASRQPKNRQPDDMANTRDPQ